MVTSRFESTASSAYCSRPSRARLPFTLGTSARSASTLPYCRTSSMAVFSPMPFTPGTLSEASPMSASTSMNCTGSRPYASRKISSVIVSNSSPLYGGRKMHTCGERSWRKSLSGETITERWPSASTFLTSAPMRSSAS